MRITLDLPDETLAHRSPEEVGRELRFAAATFWYHQGEISQSRAAEIAGMTRLQYLEELANRQIDVFVVDFDDLERELARDLPA